MNEIKGYSITLSTLATAWGLLGCDVQVRFSINSPFVDKKFYLKSILWNYNLCDSNAVLPNSISEANNDSYVVLRVYGTAGNVQITNYSLPILGTINQNGYELWLIKQGQYFYEDAYFTDVATFDVRFVNYNPVSVQIISTVYAELKHTKE
jgi:hypothetical protein